MGKASLPKTPINDTLDANRERKKQFGRERSSFSGISSITTSIGSGVNSTGNTEQQVIGLSTGGGTMTGPIAFHPKTGTISNGTINLEQTEAYSSRIIVNGQGATSDDLEVILNASHAGQILFFQPVTVGHTITLQDFAKTATAWATGTSYSIGDVRLSNSRRYTCYVAHTSSASTQPTTGSDWSDKWHRNNIHIPGATEKVVQANEIILLQYDQSSNITWTLVSGGGSGSGMTNPATAQLDMAAFSIKGAWGGTANVLGIESDLDMNTYDIKDLDRVFFNSNTDNFANTDNVLLRNNNGFNWNLAQNSDTHAFYFAGVKEFEIKNTQITTNNVIPDAGGVYTVGTASDTYLEGYFTRVKDVQNLQGDGVNLMKVIFDEGLDSDTYISGTLTSPRDRINHVVNGVNQQWWVEDSAGNKEIGIASSQNIQFNLGDNWMLLKGRGVVTPGSNSQANLFFDSSDDVLKIRKKNASGVVSTVSLEGGGTGMQNPATASLDMNSKTIVDIDWLTFDSISTPSVTNATIYTDGSDILAKKVSGSGVNLTSGFASGTASGSLNMNTNIIYNSGNISINGGSQLSVNTTSTNAGFYDAGHTSNPSSAVEGDMYYNSSSNVYRFYDGSAWVDMTGSGGGSGANTSLSNLSSPTLNTNINANDKNINTLSYIRFNPSGISTSGVEGQIWYDGSNFKASTSTGSSFIIGSGGSSWNGNATSNLDMNGNDILDAGTVQIDTLSSNAGAIYMDKQLGMSTSVRINFNAGSTSTGQGTQRSKPSSTCEGYFNIKVGNANKRVAYYS